MITKKELRKTLLQKRKDLSMSHVERSSKHASKTLCTLPDLSTFKRVVAYSAIDNEIDVSAFVKHCYQQDIPVYYPKFSELGYIFVRCNKQSSWISGKFNVQEPELNTPILSTDERLSADTLWLVPGIAFSSSNARLGYGQGIYDRALQNSLGTKIGLCYDFQYGHEFQTAPHDIAMTTTLSS